MGDIRTGTCYGPSSDLALGVTGPPPLAPGKPSVARTFGMGTCTTSCRPRPSAARRRSNASEASSLWNMDAGIPATECVVRRGNFSSLAALNERLLLFIDYFNRTFVRPFRWTFTGRPTTAETVQCPATWKENGASCREDSKILALAD